MQRVGIISIFIAMFFVTGGHWAVMQTFAWASMIKTYSTQMGSLSRGIEKTFSGRAPCEKCCQIKKALQKEQKSANSIKAEKTETFLALRASLLPLPDSEENSFPPVQEFKFSLRAEEPPSPVPLLHTVTLRSHLGVWG